MLTNGWSVHEFDEVFDEVSAGNIKTKQLDYLPEGLYPIVDQGQALISGYSDDKHALCKINSPVIIFGDHTRILKYIDFPFGMGADGVKVLKTKIETDTKFLYYYLQTLNIPNTGYNRHFKYLKRSTIPLPPLAEQKRIAAILDQADALRGKRRAALARLDALVQSLFLEMFGDPVTNSHGWEIVTLDELVNGPVRNGISPSTNGSVTGKVLTLSAITGGFFRPEMCKVALFDKELAEDKVVDSRDLLICRGNGNLNLVGAALFPTTTLANVIFPDTMIAFRLNHLCFEKAYLETIWKSLHVRNQIESAARTTNGTYKVNQTVLKQIHFPFPPKALQTKFQQFVSHTRMMQSKMSTIAFDNLFHALQQCAFRGDL